LFVFSLQANKGSSKKYVDLNAPPHMAASTQLDICPWIWESWSSIFPHI